jgi:UDP-GlcNAc:undecaprenyl-phosphate/decaprenyl-phosphate GlcNAc-1-phosphate transferase
LPDQLQLAGTFAFALVAALVLVPFARRIALRTDFVDVPGGYKGHARTTPYLGGMALVVAVGLALFVSGAATSRFAALFVWAFVLFVVGTVDDKRNLSPLARLMVEIVAAAAIWHYSLGWAIFGNDLLNLALTVVWVVGLVNAFNLMDNMDGAAASVAGVSAAGTAALGVIYGDMALALIGVSLSGACLGFLRYNLARPAKIFLGDGGSMPIGFMIAGAVMAAPGAQHSGWSAILAMTPMVGLPILDTTLVVISRRRGGRPVLSGGRDHLTHRLKAVLGSARAVVIALAAVQAALCTLALGVSQLGTTVAIVAAAAFAGAGAFAIFVLETPGRGRLETVSRALPADSVTPENSTA